MGENMICPACNKFQPKAVECVECGVVIAKAQATPASSATSKPKDKPADSSTGSSLPVIGGVLLVAALSVGYLLTQDETPAQPAADTPSPADTSMAGKLNLAESTIQRAATQQKLRALVTKLHVQVLEFGSLEPPTNEQGLAKLVRDGLLDRTDIKDAWGRDFIYELQMGPDMGIMGQEYEVLLHSAGPDGIDGTGDEIGI